MRKVPGTNQCTETARIAFGLGSFSPSDRKTWLQALSSMAFIGDPWPMTHPVGSGGLGGRRHRGGPGYRISVGRGAPRAIEERRPGRQAESHIEEAAARQGHG